MWGQKLWLELFNGGCAALATCSQQLPPPESGFWGDLCYVTTVAMPLIFSDPPLCFQSACLVLGSSEDSSSSTPALETQQEAFLKF